ncbi:GntR family transcriptional regulator [Companilactobacillus sp. DQM5]|uniref:GntR family transcriptional regulator n=1 Tax=Companilactobacillus sp. DQM5 TaxID=3463359 RepID=UPI004059C4C1
MGDNIIYHTIAEQIIDSILNKEFKTKLPTEAQLMELYGVSRNTIRRAIDVVFQRGLLKRVQGSGYFINDISREGKLVVNLSMGAGNPIRVKDSKLESKILSFDLITADKQLSKESKIPLGTKLYKIVRLRYLQGDLYCLETAYYVKSVVPYIPKEVGQRSIFNFVKETYDINVTNSENYMSVTSLDRQQAKHLNKSIGSQELTLTQYNYCKNNVLFNYSYSMYVYPNINFYFNSTRSTES